MHFEIEFRNQPALVARLQSQPTGLSPGNGLDKKLKTAKVTKSQSHKVTKNQRVSLRAGSPKNNGLLQEILEFSRSASDLYHPKIFPHINIIRLLSLQPVSLKTTCAPYVGKSIHCHRFTVCRQKKILWFNSIISARFSLIFARAPPIFMLQNTMPFSRFFGEIGFARKCGFS